MSGLITAVINIFNKLIGLLIPFFAYNKGKKDAAKEIQEEETKKEVLSLNRILQMERNIRELKDAELDNILRGGTGDNNGNGNNPTS